MTIDTKKFESAEGMELARFCAQSAAYSDAEFEEYFLANYRRLDTTHLRMAISLLCERDSGRVRTLVESFLATKEMPLSVSTRAYFERQLEKGYIRERPAGMDR